MGRFDGLEFAAQCAAAFHEAGHVLAALTTGSDVDEVEIFPENGGVGGLTRLASDDNELDDDEYDAVRVGLMAGQEAESRWFTRHPSGFVFLSSARAHTRCGSSSDMDLFARMCRKKQGSLSRGQARARAQQLVIRHWGRIDRLADRLTQRHRLTGLTAD